MYVSVDTGRYNDLVIHVNLEKQWGVFACIHRCVCMCVYRCRCVPVCICLWRLEDNFVTVLKDHPRFELGSLTGLEFTK